jgi:hypothetical protein
MFKIELFFLICIIKHISGFLLVIMFKDIFGVCINNRVLIAIETIAGHNVGYINQRHFNKIQKAEHSKKNHKTLNLLRTYIDDDTILTATVIDRIIIVTQDPDRPIILNNINKYFRRKPHKSQISSSLKILRAIQKYKDDKCIIKKILRRMNRYTVRESHLKHISAKLRDDPEIAKLILKKYAVAHSSKYISDRLMNSKRFAICMLACSSVYIDHFTDKVKKNKQILILCSIKNSSSVKHTTELKKLSDNRKFVKHMVNMGGWALRHASERLRDDREIVQMAVTTYYVALMYASKRLKDDVNMIRYAMTSDPDALLYASYRIRRDAKKLGLKPTHSDIKK